MDPVIEEVEEKFIKVSDLLRAQAFVKQLKKEVMDPDDLELMQTTYLAIQRVKVINEDIEKLNKRRALTAKGQHQLYLLETKKIYLLEKIRGATQLLESKTNFLTTRAVTISVVEDLAKATEIFRRKVS